MSGSPSLLFVLDTATGLNPDGKEDGGGCGERECWPLKSDARVTATTKLSMKPRQERPVFPWVGAMVKKQRRSKECEVAQPFDVWSLSP